MTQSIVCFVNMWASTPAPFRHTKHFLKTLLQIRIAFAGDTTSSKCLMAGNMPLMISIT